MYAVNSQGPLSLSDNLFRSEEEQRYYHIYQTQTANELSGVFSPDVWGHLILQACHNEDFVKHAVVGIAALYMTVEDSSERHGSSSRVISASLRERSVAHHRVALQQYSKSVNLLRSAPQKRDAGCLRNLLLGCILIVCFENFHGDHHNAIRQAHIGLTLYRDWLENEAKRGGKCQPGISPRPEVLEDSIVCAMSRLESLYSLKLAPAIREAHLNVMQEVPAQFTSPEQARYYLEVYNRYSATQQNGIRIRLTGSLCGGVLPGRLSTMVQNLAATGALPSIEQSPRQSVEQQIFLSKWFESFQPVLEHARSPAGSAWFQSATMLLVHYTSLEFVEKHLFDFGNETWYDAHLYSMKSCISLLRQALDPTNCAMNSRTQPRKARFTFDMHYLCLVFLISVKCRDFETRRSAIELLDTYPVREGIWDSSMVAAIAKRCMELEEEGLSWGEFVPDAKRLRIAGCDNLFSERKTIFKYVMPQMGMKEIEVPWS